MTTDFRSVGSAVSGTGTSAAVPVPSGAAINDVVLVALYSETGDASFTAPSGFTQKSDSGTANATTRGRLTLFWKRLTAADTGTYSFSWTTSAVYEAVATAYKGIVTFGDPFDGSISAVTSASTTATTATIPTLSTPPVRSGGILVGFATAHTTGSNPWTPPGTAVERYDGSAHLEVWDEVGIAAGATGTRDITLTSATGNSFPKAIMGVLSTDAAVWPVASSSGVASTTTTITLPTGYDTGHRLLLTVSAKPDTAANLTIDQGWTLVGSGTAGTGTQGADTGAVLWLAYAKDATSSSETAPTITVGSPGTNSLTWVCQAFGKGADRAWADSIAGSANWVKVISDTDTASPLTGTTSSFTNQPTTGDALAAVAVLTTDGNGNLSAASLSATGLSNGIFSHTSTSRNGTSAGNDTGAQWTSWHQFTGTASSGITGSFTGTVATNHSGGIVVYNLRTASSSAEVTAAWNGSGVFTAAVVAVGVVAASWTGSGAFTTSSVEVEQTAAAWNGSGAFTATAFEVYDRAASWTGSGSWSADVEADRQVIADWTGSGAFSASGFQVGVTTAAWSGSGSFSASSLEVEVVSAAWAGSGSWTADVEAIDGGVAADWQGFGEWTAYTTYLVWPQGDTSNRDDGIDLEGTADVIWEPDVVPVPELIGPRLEKDVRVAATVFDVPPTLVPNFAKAQERTQYAGALRERIVAGDEDISFLRGVPTRVENIRLIDPLRYGSATITLEQVDLAYDTIGAGDLAWIKDFAPVRVQLVDADDVVIVPDYYKGFITRINTDGPSLSLDLGGQAAGSLSLLQVPNTVYRRKQDVEHICVDLLRDARVRAHEHAGSSGIGLIKRGASDGLSIFNETLSVWAGATGDPITFTPRDSDGAYRKTVKDTTTIHGTVYVDHGLISQSIARDLTTELRRVYANGFTEAGELVTNIKTPGMTQGETPAFPLASGSLVVDMTDADTTTGAGITVLQEQLALHNWLDIDEAENGVFDSVTGDAVVAFKTQAGTASLTPAVSESAWNLLWNLTRVGYSLDDAREYPMAEDPAVRKWNRTANGSKIEPNPLYDPHIKPVGEFIDVGGPFTGGEIRGFAGSRLRTGDVWVGTLTFRSGLVRGDHSPGDPFTTADVMDRRELLPNMRLSLPYFQGGKVFYVTGVEHGLEETTASVATQPESTYETWAAIARVREAKSNVARMAQGHVRQSQVRRDVGPSWDKSSGWIANKVAVVTGWNEVKVPAGQAGLIRRVKVELETPAEFALLITKKRVSLDALNSRPAISQPLTDPRPAGRPWWEREANADWLDSRGFLVAWGTEQQPCGYDPSLKTDDGGATGAPITGKFVEQASADYDTDPSEPVLFMYVWVSADNNVKSGRILRNQRTADF